MSEIFFNITGTVLVLNILFLLIPDGKYAKYVQFVAGLIVIMTVAGNFIDVSIDYSSLDFDEASLSGFDEQKFRSAVRKYLTEDSIETKIKETVGIDTEVDVSMHNNEFSGVTVFTDSSEHKKITEVIVQYCDINRNLVVIK